jgi:hypothetical protein
MGVTSIGLSENLQEVVRGAASAEVGKCTRLHLDQDTLSCRKYRLGVE